MVVPMDAAKRNQLASPEIADGIPGAGSTAIATDFTNSLGPDHMIFLMPDPAATWNSGHGAGRYGHYFRCLPCGSRRFPRYCESESSSAPERSMPFHASPFDFFPAHSPVFARVRRSLCCRLRAPCGRTRQRRRAFPSESHDIVLILQTA